MTVRDYINTLPEPIKEKAMSYCLRDNSRSLTYKMKSLTYALAVAFNWTKTEEGKDYWIEITKKHETNG